MVGQFHVPGMVTALLLYLTRNRRPSNRWWCAFEKRPNPHRKQEGQGIGVFDLDHFCRQVPIIHRYLLVSMPRKSIPTSPTNETVLLRIRVTRQEYRAIRRIAADNDQNIGDVLGDAVGLLLRYHAAQGTPAQLREEACDE